MSDLVAILVMLTIVVGMLAAFCVLPTLVRLILPA
jgi:hypothetical protein